MVKNGEKPYAAVPPAARRYDESVNPVPRLGSSAESGSSAATHSRIACTTGPSGGEALPGMSGSGHVSS